MSASCISGQMLDGTAGGENSRAIYDVKQDNSNLILRAGESEKRIREENVIAVVDKRRSEDSTEVAERYFVLLIATKTEDQARKEFRFESFQLKNVPGLMLDKYCISSLPPHLIIPRGPGDDTPNIHVIISIRSGTGEAQDFFDNVIRHTFETVGLEESAYRVHVTESERSVTQLARTVFLPRANDGIAQTILLLSGDGGIVDIVNVLLSSSQSLCFVKPAIGLVAMGTGNALANSTGLNRGITRGLGNFFRGTPHSLPTFTARFSSGSKFLVNEGRSAEPLPSLDDGSGVVYGAVVCSWALHASLVADSDTTEYRRHGRDRFQMAANGLLAPSDGSEPHVYKGRITLMKLDQDGQEIHHILGRQEHMYILATLVSNLEEKFTVSPHSKPLDGQLRLVHFGPVSSSEVMRLLGMAFQGGDHVDDELIGYEKIAGLRIDFDEKDSRWRRVCVDGKIVRVSENGWVEVRKSTRDVVDIIADLR